MRIIVRILLIAVASVAAVAAVLFAVAYLLPREATVVRSVVVDAAPEAIFPYVNSMRATEQWSPWIERDPDVELTYEGPVFGVGAKLVWASDHPEVGSGIQIIAVSVPNERVETELDFGPMGTAKAAFVLTPQGEGTLVAWEFATDLGLDPFARYFGLALDGMIGAEYEEGLENLKALIESK